MGHRHVYDAEFAARAVDLGVADLVVPTDWLNGEELQCAYAATDVFVTPSICFDTFGLVNLEAMEHAKPVVATEFGGSPEVVEHGVTGYVENPIDAPAYAARITELLADEDLRRRMGEAGRRRLRETFTIERLTAEYLEEYHAALEAVGRVPAGV
jgi:glycosyltransferase involved in cell wall biosynthesis